MSRECVIRLLHGLRFVAACPAGTHFLPVSPTPDDVCCLRSAEFARFLTAWGDGYFFTGFPPGCFLTCTVGQFFSAFLSGLACRPTDLFIVRFVGLFFEGRQSWLGGLVSLVWWLGLFLVFVSVLSNCESVSLLVTRLGLMPYSAWSKAIRLT